MIAISRQAMLASAAGIASVAVLATQALAYSEPVTSACTGDYLAYCSSYDENSVNGRQCMRAVGAKLSQGCINALVASGEASKNEAARRAVSKR